MIKGVLFLFAVLALLMGLLVWAKTRPAPTYSELQFLFAQNTPAGGIQIALKEENGLNNPPSKPT